ncbi:TraN protein [Xanthomonas citri pv. fuscans]|nr:TraN protein [Xanthomonas citri pv. fuscans]
MSTGKLVANVVFALFCLAVATVGALYLAGYIYILLNKKAPTGVSPWTWYSYWHYYGGHPVVATKLKVSAALAAIVCYLVPTVIVLTSLRRRRELHGSARFASAAEIQKSALNGSNGIVVGRHGKRYLIFEGQQFVALAAPTRSGKGVGFVVPNLLQFQDSVVVLDIKQENFDITAGYRKVNGHDIFLFNPFAEDFRSHRYNMLGYVSDDAKYRVSDVQSIAQALYPDPANGKDPFFDQAARNLFLGLVLYLCETPMLPRTIGELLRQSSGKGKPVKEYLQGLINARNFTEQEEWEDVLDGDGIAKIDKDTGEVKRRKVKVLVPRVASDDDQRDPMLSDHCVDALNRFLATSDNTLTSILASLNAPLSIWANPIVDAATSANDFDLRDVRKRRMTIYVGITPDHLAESALLINVFFSQLVNLNTKELPKQNPALKHQCLLLMDEFTAIGKVGIIASAVSYMAGYNLRLAPVIQSVAQLSATYGKDSARTLMTNHALQIMYAPREQTDANEYSEMLGTFTEKNKSKSRSLGKGGGSESTSDQRRALMLPQELKEIGQWKQIIMLENVKPILCDKIRYFDDPVFTERVLEAPPIPLLDLDLHQAIVEARTRELVEDDVAGGVDLGKLAINLGVISELSSDGEATEEQVQQAVNELFSCFGAEQWQPADEDEASAETESASPDANEEGSSEQAAVSGRSTDEGEPVNMVEPVDWSVVDSKRESDSSAVEDTIVSDQSNFYAPETVDLSILNDDEDVLPASFGDDAPPSDGLLQGESDIDLNMLDG